MKRQNLLPLRAVLLSGIAAGWAGCGRQTEPISAVTEALIVGPEYSANKGLYVPEATRKSLGLKIIDAEEEKLAATREISLRVFEHRGEHARASGTLSAEEAKGVEVGTEVKLDASANGLLGKIVGLGRQAQETAGTVEVIVEFPRSTDLAVGKFATGNVTLPAAGLVTTVPRSALIRSTDGDFVYTVSGEHFVRTPVKLGTVTEARVEIKEGLYSGDRVVAEPAMSLWLTELAAIKGGHACCVVPPKGK